MTAVARKGSNAAKINHRASRRRLQRRQAADRRPLLALGQRLGIESRAVQHRAV
ncbi:hypothetical protein M8494_26790 [Serratia ureilytica]